MRNGDSGCNCDGATMGFPVASSLAMGDGPPLLRQAVDACFAEVERCRTSLSNAANPATASRALVRRETAVDVDENPYHGLDRNKIEAVVRAAYHARAMPEVLLAKWMKEGSARMTLTATPVPGATTEANARAILRSRLFYVELGVDWLTVTTRPDPAGDNILDTSDAGAPAQERHFQARVRELVQGRVLSEDISAAVNAELRVTRSGSTFSVQPTVKFYALSLILVDAVFSRFLAMSFTQMPVVGEELGYMLWNMGEASFRTFLRSADTHRRETQHLVNGQPISIEQWALHTRPRSNEWAQPRRNAIRFAHYIRSYRPVFRNSITLIKPGIEDLPRTASHALSSSEDPLGLGPISGSSIGQSGATNGGGAHAEPSSWAYGDLAPVAGALAVIANGRGTFRHAPLDGNQGTGDNVEARWNLERAPADSRVDIVVHLHGYGGTTRDFLARKAALAGVDLVHPNGSPRRASRPTLALVPRGHNAGDPVWLFDRLDSVAEFTALVRASLDWLGTAHLGLAAGALQPGRCILHAHSGGGAGLSALLAAGVDPDEVVCFDSTYGSEQPIIQWARRRLAGASATASGLRVFYLPCSGGSSQHPGGQWVWNTRRRVWDYVQPGSWRFRNGQWRLTSTEIAARRIHGALESALAGHAQRTALAPRFRVERTRVEHGDIPAQYAPALLEDIGRDVSGLGPRTPSAFAPPPMSQLPACVANADWARAGSTPVKPHGTPEVPPRPTAPPAEAHEIRAFEQSTIRPIPISGFRSVPITGQEFDGPAWVEVAWRSRALAPGYADLESVGLARPGTGDTFEIRVRGRLVVPPGLARRTEPVPLVVICMGNHQAFDRSVTPAREVESFEGYDYLQQALAQSGYASLSVDTNPANEIDAGIRMRADLIWATIAELQDHVGGSSELRGKIDFQNVAFVGHSRGGEAVVMAAKLNANPAWRAASWAGRTSVRVRAVAAIAPTDFSRGKSSSLRIEFPPPSGGAFFGPTATASFGLHVGDAERFLVLYGSHDGDVSGDADPPFFDPANRAGTGFSLYDRSTIDKTMAFARGITHNRFNTKWNECPSYVDFGHAFVHPFTCAPLPGERFDPFIFSAQSHRNLAIFYVGALLDRVLKSDASKEAVLRGERAINADHAVAIQFQLLDRVSVHEFEASSGLTPASVTLRDAAEIQHCPHDTRLFQGAAGATVRMDVPASSRDLRTRSALTLRLGALYDVTDNPTIRRSPLPKFNVRLVTSTGDGRASQDNVSRRGVLTPDRPYFYRAWFRFRDGTGSVVAARANASKRHLDTVVIPLSAFTPADRTRPISLSDVQAIELEIGTGGTEPVLVDSVAFI